MNHLPTTPPVDRVLANVRDTKQNGSGWVSRCPAHDDRHASLSVSVGGDGRALVYCHAGCMFEAIVEALGLTPADLMPSNGSHQTTPKPKKPPTTYPTAGAAQAALQRQHGKPTKVWIYHDAEGEPVGYALRWDGMQGKQILPVSKHGTEWRCAGMPTPRPLYGLPDLAGAERVYVCEGEKCCDALRSLGLTATTSAHGSRSARQTDWAPLVEGDVVVLPDHDPAGAKYGETAVEILLKLDPSPKVRVVNLPGLGDGEDVVEFIEVRDSRESEDIVREIEALVDQAEVQTLTSATAPVPEPARSGKPRFPWTDLGNAERLIHLHGENFRFRPARTGTDLAGTWLRWDGVRWIEDTRFEIQRRAKASVRSMFGGAARIEDDAKRKSLIDFARACESKHRLANMISLAKCEPGVAVDQDAFDVDPWLLNVQNGTLDLRTGKLREHRRGDLCTKLAPVVYDSGAKAERWQRVLQEIIPSAEVRVFLQKLIGVCLTGDVSEHILPIFHGEGSNGKSVFIDTIKGLMGDYAADAPPDLLTLRHNDQHPTELADLYGRRLIVASETEEGRQLRTQLVKRITGDATLKGRFMRENFFEFKRTFLTILATNNRPVVREPKHAIWRRIKLVPFNVTIPDDQQDKHLIEKLRAEWPGILAWAVGGCLAWQRDGLNPPAEVETATAEYRESQDVLGPLVEACLEFHPNAQVSLAALWEAYSNWADTTHERHPLGREALLERLRSRGCESIRFREHGNVRRGLKGVGLRVQRVISAVES